MIISLISIEEFSDLTKADGAFDRLKQAVLEIRKILGSAPLSADEDYDLGHCGIPGQYSNGFSSPYEFYIREHRPFDAKTSIQYLIDAFDKPSQLSIEPTKLKVRSIASENGEQGFERAITETKEWAKNSPKISATQGQELLSLIKQVEENFAPIKKFVADVKSQQRFNTESISVEPHQPRFG